MYEASRLYTGILSRWMVKGSNSFTPARNTFTVTVEPFGRASAHHFVSVHLHTGNDRVVHFDDAVAGQDADFLGRSSRYGLDDKEGVGSHIKLDTDAIEVSLKGFVEPLHFFRVGIGGVRVELFQHADNGGFHQFVFVYLIYIEIGDGELGQLQFARRRIEQLVLGRQGSPCRTSCQ